MRRATPQAQKVFNLIPSDVGRRLSDIKSNLRLHDLDQMIRAVIDDLGTRELEVQDRDGHNEAGLGTLRRQKTGAMGSLVAWERRGPHTFVSAHSSS